MEKKVIDFLNELKALLEKYDTSIVRSAADTHKLVTVTMLDNKTFDHISFDEEINESAIEFEWYRRI